MEQTQVEVAAEQQRRVFETGSVDTRPVVLGDSEYGSASFLVLIEDLGNYCDFLLRVRPNRVFYKEPSYYGIGRPREYGDPFSQGATDLGSTSR